MTSVNTSYYLRRRLPRQPNVIWHTVDIFYSLDEATAALNTRTVEPGWEYAIHHQGEVIARRAAKKS